MSDEVKGQAESGSRVDPLPVARVWAAIHTKARAEKVVAAQLARLEVPHFLPLRLNRRRYGARLRESWIPLFPGYLFYDHAAIDRRRVFDTRRVAQILVPDDPGILAQDLDNLARALVVQPDMDRCPSLPAGSPVEVISGALTGRTGRLVRETGRTLLVIAVDFVGFGAEVQIEERDVRPLSAG